MYRGATATQVHAIAAIYIGISIAFGRSMIEWADIRFQYYVMKQGAKPVKRFGMDYAKHYFKSWGQHVLAFLIGAGILFVLIYLINDSSRTEVLAGFLKYGQFYLFGRKGKKGSNLIISQLGAIVEQTQEK